MEKVPPLIFATVTLLDPACTGIISWGFGIENFPDFIVWLGASVVIGGVAMITFGDYYRNEETNKTIEIHDNNENNLKSNEIEMTNIV